jgi:hypothetical protein
MIQTIITRCLVCLASCFLLAACTSQPTLSDVTVTPPTLHPSGKGETLALRYTIGCQARVSLFIEDSQGKRYVLRADEPRFPADDPYTLRFDGTVPTDDPVIQRRLLPAGTYTAVVQAASERCGNDEARVPIVIANTNVVLPDLENLHVSPETISPNADAIADVAEITYRLPVTATVGIGITAPNGQSFPLLTREEQQPAEWSHIWNGKRPDGSLLPNGVYTCTITAEDDYGNRIQREQPIHLVEVGEPAATITYASIAPEQVMLGGMITVTMRVRNTGIVPIRTYGPPSGTPYTTDEVFSSIANGRYTVHAGGFWRIGVDWDANSGDGPKRYPFRWALSDRPPDEWKVPGEEDWLMPGEEVEIIGNVVIYQRETKMGFYVGLIQDGVGFYQNRTARTVVEVGF